MIVSAIAAVAENNIIGSGNELPWRLPADLRWFVEHTRGKPLIFGRRTYESTGYLPRRKNIVVTRTPGWTADPPPDAVVPTFEDALAAAGEVEEVMILGGAQLYESTLPHWQRLYLTVVHANPLGDTLFPDVNFDDWDVLSQQHHPADEENEHAMTFFVLERRSRNFLRNTNI